MIISLRKAKQLAAAKGADVGHQRRTGEIVFKHESLHALRVNGRRKDAPRALVSWLRRLEENDG